MTDQTPKHEDDIKDLAGKFVYIIGQRKFQNELVAFYLERETAAECVLCEDISDFKSLDIKKPKEPFLILIECLDKDFLEGFSSLFESDNVEKLLLGNPVALFNVDQGQGIEEKAVARGVKGIFYSQDPLDRFQKGLKAIFEGELWVSREVLTKYVIKNRGKDRVSGQDDTILTQREIEILAMISAGAKNEDIADKLYISPNTVKTHIYNIFKKINVPNRLQAALWAAKNL